MTQTMSAGDPPPYWNYNMPYPPPGSISQPNDFTAVEMADIRRRLEQLEAIIIKQHDEQKIREENSFVRDLYDQYKVALILASDSDE